MEEEVKKIEGETEEEILFYVPIEEIEGNEDLHKIAKEVGLENGLNLLPKNVERKVFIDEIIKEIYMQLESFLPIIDPRFLMEKLKEISEIKEKEGV